MRFRGLTRGIPGLFLAVVMLVGVMLPGGRAAAEAPFFYDDLVLATFYDPELDPLNRHGGLAALLVQGWSQPDADQPRQSLGRQDYSGQYRFQWFAPLDIRYNLLIELKASTKGQVIPGDYFLRTEFVYKGIPIPLWVYGGMRIPQDSEVLMWAGAESMSFKPYDMWNKLPESIPVALRGWAEIRYTLDDAHPVFRYQLLLHNTRIGFVPNLTLGVGMDMFFQLREHPHWVLQGHAEYGLTQGAARASIIAGYGLDLAHGGEQRGSLGIRAGLF